MSFSRRRGFTLIEVLVVVAIIALLVAILLPSLTRAREATRATVCATHIKEALNGTLLHYHETGMRRETWSTNFGWAVFSMKVSQGAPELFTCPSDPEPLPIPAVFDRMFVGDEFVGTTTSDAIFNRVYKRSGSQWELDIQDQAQSDAFGGDAYSDASGDVILSYTANSPGQYTTTATARPGVIAWKHDLYPYKGGTKLWTVTNGGADNGPQGVPLLWMSYGANASAGLEDVQGNPILVAEARKLGLFPETLGNYQADHLPRALRFRHGSKVGLEGLQGANYARGDLGFNNIPNPLAGLGNAFKDNDYTPRNRMNAGFFDGHVDSINYQQMFPTFDNSLAIKSREGAKPKKSLWIGTRRGKTTF